MKFSISSFHPFAWFSKQPMTEDEILCYDLHQELNLTRSNLRRKELGMIKLEHDELRIKAQLAFLHGEQDPAVLFFKKG